MKVLIYSAKPYEIPFLNRANRNRFAITFTKEALDSTTAIQAVGYKAISIFSGDDASSIVLEKLWDFGVRYIALRSAGHNNIRIKTAKALGFKIANVPEYSPHAIAEHATALLLSFTRKIVRANRQVQQFDFSQTGLLGHTLHGKTIGIIGTGRIGSVMAKIMHGFGCHILACDLKPDMDLVELCDVTYKPLEQVLRKADIISLHIPLTYDNHHLIDQKKLALMRKDAILVNTARGAIIDTKALLDTLEKSNIGGYCADVYEKEKGIFFTDHSNGQLKDEQLRRLLSLSNVLLTPHQAFMTHEALANIAETTFGTFDDWAADKESKNELGLEWVISD